MRSFSTDSGIEARGIFHASGSLRRDSSASRPKSSHSGGEVGRVAIVGAGPGDPELLTLKALRRLEAAEVVVYDRLVAPEILDYVRAEAVRIYAGKGPGKHACSQKEINALLVEHALQGRKVVRLKGGDPFVFGRGGEEMDELRAYGIPVEIVPGITAATGCAAAAGVPLTHRDHVQAVTFVTAHSREGGDDALDWAALAARGQTLAIYMGIGQAGRAADRLMEHGLKRATPVAVVEKGTTPEQRVVATTLERLQDSIDAHAIKAPALLIVGEVAAYAGAVETVTASAFAL